MKSIVTLAFALAIQVVPPATAQNPSELEPKFEMKIPPLFPARRVPRGKKYCEVWVSMKASRLKQTDELTIEFLDVKPDSSFEEVARQALIEWIESGSGSPEHLSMVRIYRGDDPVEYSATYFDGCSRTPTEVSQGKQPDQGSPGTARER